MLAWIKRIDGFAHQIQSKNDKELSQRCFLQGKTMHPKKAVCFLLILTFCACQLQWREFSPDSGRFHVLLPGEPEIQQTTVASQFGEMTVYSFTVILNRQIRFYGRGFYTVRYKDIPLDSIEDKATEVVFDYARNRANAEDGELQSTLVSEDKFSLGGHPGIQMNIKIHGTGLAGNEVETLVKKKIILVGNRLYELSVGGMEEASTKDAEKFFNSFTVNDNR